MWPAHCVRRTKGAEFAKECQPNKHDIVVSKGKDPKVDSLSGFGTPPETSQLLEKLKEGGINRLFCMGLTHCVAQTAIDGVIQGFESYIVTDATRSTVKAA